MEIQQNFGPTACCTSLDLPFGAESSKHAFPHFPPRSAMKDLIYQVGSRTPSNRRAPTCPLPKPRLGVQPRRCTASACSIYPMREYGIGLAGALSPGEKRHRKGRTLGSQRAKNAATSWEYCGIGVVVVWLYSQGIPQYQPK